MKAPSNPFERREFLRAAGATALASIGMSAAPAFCDQKKIARPESLVKLLFSGLNEKQRKAVCFPWDHIDPKRGLLRTRLENNWRITAPTIEGTFFSIPSGLALDFSRIWEFTVASEFRLC